MDGFRVGAHSGEHLRFRDAEFVVRASSDTTGGAFSPPAFEGFFRDLAAAEGSRASPLSPMHGLVPSSTQD